MKRCGMVLSLIAFAACIHAGEFRWKDYQQVRYQTESPWNRKAAELLKQYGVSGNGGKTILLGDEAKKAGLITDDDLAKLGPDGYVVRIKDGMIGIAGKNTGVLNGVCALLRKCGHKYYAYGCEVLPNPDTVLADGVFSGTPANGLRLVGLNYGENSQLQGFPLVLLGHSPEFLSEKLSVRPRIGWTVPNLAPEWEHTAGVLIPKKEFLKTHPEYYAKDANGKVKISLTASDAHADLCLSNKEVQKLLYERMREWISKTPEGTFFQLAPADNWGFCECPECKKLDPFPVDQSGKYYTMMDRWLKCTGWIFEKLIAEFPDKAIGTHAYFCTEAPPVEAKVPKGLYIMFCPVGNCNGHDLTCRSNKAVWDNMQKWNAFKDCHRIVFDYPMNYQNRMNLYFTLDSMNSRMRMYSQWGAEGICHCGVPEIFADLYLYEQGLLAWTPMMPQEELAAREQEFMKAFYGHAAQAMTEYLALVRKQAKEHCIAMYNANSAQFSAEYARQAYALFAKAEKAAASDPVVLKRVRRDKLAGVVFSDVCMGSSSRQPWENLKLFQEFVLLSESAEFAHGFGPGWQKFVEEKVNIFIAGPYYPWNRNPARRYWYKDPALAPLLACKTEKDFRTLAGKLGLDQLTKWTYEHKDGKIAFLPDEQKNDMESDPAGAKKRVVVLQGGMDCSVPFQCDAPSALTGAKLTLEGLDHDKEGKVPLEILLNNQVVFSGKSSLPKDKWGTMTISLPDNLVKNGKNILIVRNCAQPASYANWTILSSMEISPAPSVWKRIVWQEDFEALRKSGYKGVVANREHGSMQLQTDKKVLWNGLPTFKITTSRIGKNANLQFWRNISAQQLPLGDCQYRVTFYLKAQKPDSVRVLCFTGREGIYNKVFQVNPYWTKISYVLTVRASYRGTSIQIPRLLMNDPKENVIYMSPTIVEGM